MRGGGITACLFASGRRPKVCRSWSNKGLGLYQSPKPSYCFSLRTPSSAVSPEGPAERRFLLSQPIN
jgi:hypothetical protein